MEDLDTEDLPIGRELMMMTLIFFNVLIMLIYTQRSRYSQDKSLHQDSTNHYQCDIKIMKSGGSCYAFLVLIGREADINSSTLDDQRKEPKEFLSRTLFDDISKVLILVNS